MQPFDTPLSSVSINISKTNDNQKKKRGSTQHWKPSRRLVWTIVSK